MDEVREIYIVIETLNFQIFVNVLIGHLNQNLDCVFIDMWSECARL